jgi:phosphopantothenoylcysteine synthetase/decarboxylase
MSKSKILFQLSGSIAAFKACQVISQLVKQNYEVKVVCTPSTFEFVGKATLEGLTKNVVLSSSFETGHGMAHIDLARWADLLILCPATANTINALASGSSANLLGDLFLANNFLRPY